jgi:hypothetical protein
VPMVSSTTVPVCAGGAAGRGCAPACCTSRNSAASEIANAAKQSFILTTLSPSFRVCSIIFQAITVSSLRSPLLRQVRLLAAGHSRLCNRGPIAGRVQSKAHHAGLELASPVCRGWTRWEEAISILLGRPRYVKSAAAFGDCPLRPA